MNRINPRISIERRCYLSSWYTVTRVTSALHNATNFVAQVKAGFVRNSRPKWLAQSMWRILSGFFYCFCFVLFLCFLCLVLKIVILFPSFDICLCVQFQLSTSQLIMMNDGGYGMVVVEWLVTWRDVWMAHIYSDFILSRSSPFIF